MFGILKLVNSGGEEHARALKIILIFHQRRTMNVSYHGYKIQCYQNGMLLCSSSPQVSKVQPNIKNSLTT